MNDNNLKYVARREKSNIFKSKTKWKNINWEKAEEYVNRLQIRIVKAKLANKNNLVKRLQYLLVNSFYAKAIAVRKVTSNKGKRTTGIDGVIWKNDTDKILAIEESTYKYIQGKTNKKSIYTKR